MRTTRIVWSLAALIVVLLGAGLGGYAQLGAGSSQSSSAAATHAAAPLGAARQPQPTAASAPTDVSPAPPETPGVGQARSGASTPVSNTTPAHRAAGPNATLGRAAPTSLRPTPARSAPAVASPAPAPPANPAGNGPPRLSEELRYVVQPNDTLWDLAAAHLGSPTRWVQLFELNRGRAEPGGAFINPDQIYVGWTLEFPANATGLPLETATGPAAPVAAPGQAPTPAVATGLVDGAGPATGSAGGATDSAGGVV